MSWPEQPAVVRAPATSANLGPGFDALGLALTLHDVAEVRVTGGGLDIEVAGAGADTAGAGERHLMVRALRAGFDALDGQPPGIALRCRNSIPHGRGLGSSAAAIVSGLLAARALAPGGPERLPGQEVLGLAASLEGHPDNVAACLAGGLTIAWTPEEPAQEGPGPAVPSRGDLGEPAPRAGTGPRLLRLLPAAGLATVACVAPAGLATTAARQALPAAIPHADAAANAARSALLIAALTGQAGVDPGVLFEATEDYLHQRYRAAVMPETADLLGRLRAAGVAAVLSGAGPSVLALTRAGLPGPDLVDSIARETGIAWRVIPLDIDRHGATVQFTSPAAHSPDSPWSMDPQGWAHAPGAGPADRPPRGSAASTVTHGRP